MKKIFSIVLSLVFVFTLAVVVKAAKPTVVDSNGLEVSWQNTACTTIQDGTLVNSLDELLTTGFDEWGYNYQAHMFNGTYCDAYRDAAWCQDWKDVDLIMKWNDAWLSNTDCEDNDALLDRHYGFDSYIGSGAWTTNHMSGEGWTYFVKIVAAPADAYSEGGFWFTADGVEIGPVIWNEFAVIQEVESGLGATYVSPNGPGFGQY